MCAVLEGPGGINKSGKSSVAKVEGISRGTAEEIKLSNKSCTLPSLAEAFLAELLLKRQGAERGEEEQEGEVVGEDANVITVGVGEEGE